MEAPLIQRMTRMNAELAYRFCVREKSAAGQGSRSRPLFITHQHMREADAVLAVEAIARRVPNLGNVVTLVRIPGGIHDLALSRPGPRAAFYAGWRVVLTSAGCFRRLRRRSSSA